METVRVEEMRNRVLAELEKMYGDGIPAPTCEPEDVESRGFLLKEHALGLLGVCQKNRYSVSFRAAGEATLKKIREGHPCKGHEILDKTIKKKADKTWTYEASANILESYCGLVGYMTAPKSGCLAGLWVENGGRATQVPLDQVTGDLIRQAYTGDYDMHDLLLFTQDRYVRIVAATPDEASAIDQLNDGMLRAEVEARYSKADHYPKDCRYEKVKSFEKSGERSTASPYSPIRHGAQTSFMCYLHGLAGGRELYKYMQEQKPEDLVEIPYQNTVMNISCPICMFDAKGPIFILDSPEKVYWYYKSRNLLNQIPFYYFFKDLKTSGLPLSEYAVVLNHYLRNMCTPK